MKKLFTIVLMTMLTVAYSWGYTTVTVTYTGTANDAFKNALEAIDATTEYSAANATEGLGNSDEKLKLVVTLGSGANFNEDAVRVLNNYLNPRWGIYREIDLSDCNTLTTLPEGAFSGRDLVRVWTMPTTITTIGNNAFDGCKEATSITFGTGVTTVGQYAFNNCEKLLSIDLTNAESIGINAFNNCKALSSLSLPKITEVPSNAFSGMNLNGDINLPKVTTVHENAFNGCTATSLTVGTAGIALSLYGGAFRNVKIPTITLHDTSVIPDYCFEGSEVTTLVMLPVTSIGKFAFADNTEMEDIPFVVSGCNGWAPSCKEIPEGCFGASGLTPSITIPDHITTINRSFVDFCYGLEEINVDENNENYSTVDGMLCNKAGNTVIVFPGGKSYQDDYIFPDEITTLKSNSCIYTYIENVTFGSGMTTIEELVFNQSAVETITINTGLTDVNHGAFANTKYFRWFNGAVDGTTYYTNGTDGLLYKKDGILYRCPEQYADAEGNKITSLDLRSNETITHIEDAAFSKCKDLTSIQLPNTVQTLGGHAFEYCEGLTTFTLPSALNPTPNENGTAGFGDAPFRGCTSLKSIEANGAGDHYHTVQNGMLCNADDTELLICPAAYANGHANDPENWDGKVKLPYTLQEIKAAAFDDCKYIKEVVIPQGVCSIETGAFQNSNVETVVIPHSMTSTHTYIDWFQNCKNLQHGYILSEEVLGQVGNSSKRFNEFYNAEKPGKEAGKEFEGLNIHVSNEYSEGGNSLIAGYTAAKHAEGTGDKGWGDVIEKGATISGMYHRAITEDYATIEEGKHWDENNTMLTTNPTYQNEKSANNYTFLTLYRKFTDANTFYTLSLPVAMTADEVTATFGEGTQIYHFTGRTNRVLNFASATTIPAGTAVLIKPANRTSSYMIDLRNSTPTATAINSSTVAGTGAAQETTGNTTVNANDETVTGVTFSYAFNPTWQKEAVMPQYGYYVGADGTVWRVTQPGRKIRLALRGYITGGNTSNVQESSNMQALGIDMDGVVSGIEDVHIEGLTTNQTGNVYNTQGQLVRKGAGTEGLPRGLYIVNGKKVFVE